MTITRETTPKQIIEWYRDRHGPLVYHSAFRSLHGILGDRTDKQTLQFALLQAYARRLLESDPGATVKLKIIGTRFSSLFVSPSFAKHAWPHLRPFIAVDAAFTETIHIYVLLIVTGLDTNNEGINLAWGVTPKENYEHWSWFLVNLDHALGGLNRFNTVIMSDRQKGLNKAVQEELGGVTETYCCKHIERNLVDTYGSEVRSSF